MNIILKKKLKKILSLATPVNFEEDRGSYVFILGIDLRCVILWSPTLLRSQLKNEFSRSHCKYYQIHYLILDQLSTQFIQSLHHVCNGKILPVSGADHDYEINFSSQDKSLHSKAHQQAESFYQRTSSCSSVSSIRSSCNREPLNLKW